MANSKTVKRMNGALLAIVFLSIGLCITTFALIYATISVEDNFFHTGDVKINLNDGAPVIREDEFLFEPGMTVEKPFFIKNESTWDVYYKLYFDDVAGDLKDVLKVSVLDKDQVIYEGTPKEMADNPPVDACLRVGEQKTLTLRFYYPKESTQPVGGNAANHLYFTLHAKAVQTKNNPNRRF